MSNVGPEDRIFAEEHRTRLKLKSMKKCLPRLNGRKLNEVIRSEPKEKKVIKDIAKGRNTWKFFIKNCPIHANMENRH